MNVTYESFQNVRLFTISGDMSSEHEDKLKLLLMKAVHGVYRSVLNFRGVTRINHNCLKLLNKAYCTSLRLKNPIIMTEIPETYLPEIFRNGSVYNDGASLNNKTGQDSEKERVLGGVH